MKPNLVTMQIEWPATLGQARIKRSRKCPVCGEIELVMTECQGVEIDYCPKCRGVWLDRGELEKIIECSISGLQQPRIRRAPLPGERQAGHFKRGTKAPDYQARLEQRRPLLKESCYA